MRRSAPPLRRRFGLGFALALWLGLAGCGLIDQADPIAASCSEAGAQCRLHSASESGGPIGVCERTQCGPGQQAPCFACTSQH